MVNSGGSTAAYVFMSHESARVLCRGSLESSDGEPGKAQPKKGASLLSLCL